MNLSIDTIRKDDSFSPLASQIPADGNSPCGEPVFKVSGMPPALTAKTPPKPFRNYLAAYLLAASALTFATYIFVINPEIQPSQQPLTAPLPPAIEPEPLASAPTPAPLSRAIPPTPPSVRSRTAPTETPSPPLHFRLTRPPEIDSELIDAHARLEAKDLDGARHAYEQILRRDPQDSGSLLALAAIAGFRGLDDEAASLRRRAIIADPGNPAAQAALLDTTSANSESVRIESRLKSLLALQAAPSLEFALGNLLARQRRWPEAQQAYFRAVAGDADNPDYLFNLAVSLEHLKQAHIAASYYRQAITASAKRAAAFDRLLAEQRAEQLIAPGYPGDRR